MSERDAKSDNLAGFFRIDMSGLFNHQRSSEFHSSLISMMQGRRRIGSIRI